MKKIEVFEISSGKLVAGDHGDSVTISSLKAKMIKKLDITDSAKYRIEEKDTSVEDAKKKQDVLDRVREISEMKRDLNLIDQSSKPAWEKKILKRLVLEL